MSGPRAVQFLVLLGVWFLLSGRTGALFVALGVAAAATVTAVTHTAVTEVLGPPLGGARTALRRAGRGAAYVTWLLTRIPPAGLQVARVVLSPSLPVQPHLLHFETALASPVARAVLANSISLVPGTVTVEVVGRRFTVHALLPESADDLVTARLQNRIADVFLQDHEPPPDIRWEPAPTGPGRAS